MHRNARCINHITASVNNEMNTSLDSQLSGLDESFQEPPLLTRCKMTIEELQRQVIHLRLSNDIKQQECEALQGILCEKDKRIEELQARSTKAAIKAST